jgi:hypothetical protein
MFNVFNKIIESGPLVTSPQAPPEFKAIVAYVYKGMSEVVNRLTSAFEQFKEPGSTLPPEIAQIMESLAGIQTEAGAATGQPGTFPRVALPPAQAVQPAATGPNPPGAADLGSLLAAVGAGGGQPQ